MSVIADRVLSRPIPPSSESEKRYMSLQDLANATLGDSSDLNLNYHHLTNINQSDERSSGARREEDSVDANMDDEAKDMIGVGMGMSGGNDGSGRRGQDAYGGGNGFSAPTNPSPLGTGGGGSQAGGSGRSMSLRKRKESHDRSADYHLPSGDNGTNNNNNNNGMIPSPNPGASFQIPAGPSSSTSSVFSNTNPFGHGHGQAGSSGSPVDPSMAEPPTKRRGSSVYDSRMSGLHIGGGDGSGGGMGPPGGMGAGGWWNAGTGNGLGGNAGERRDSGASMLSNRSGAGAGSGGGYPDPGAYGQQNYSNIGSSVSNPRDPSHDVRASASTLASAHNMLPNQPNYLDAMMTSATRGTTDAEDASAIGGADTTQGGHDGQQESPNSSHSGNDHDHDHDHEHDHDHDGSTPPELANNPAYNALSSDKKNSLAGGSGTGYSRSPELRVSHKLAERKRRKEMRDLFDELRDQLPQDRGMKSSKWEILSKAVDHIQTLKKNNADMTREIDTMRREIEGLRVGAAAAAAASGVAYGVPSNYQSFGSGYIPVQQTYPPPQQQQGQEGSVAGGNAPGSA